MIGIISHQAAKLYLPANQQHDHDYENNHEARRNNRQERNEAEAKKDVHRDGRG